MGSTPEVPRKSRADAKTTDVEVAQVQILHGPLGSETTGEGVPGCVLALVPEVQGRIGYKAFQYR